MPVHGTISDGQVKLLDPIPDEWGDGADLLIDAATPAADLTERFDALRSEWQEATKYRSFTPQIAVHPAYQRIIGLGSAVLPLILRELEKSPQHWYWALRAISGENPVPTESEGDVAKMADAWVEWGRRKALI